MLHRLLLICIMVILSGCTGHKLTSYNVKPNVGETKYDDGTRTFNTGVSLDFKFDVK